MPTAPTPLPTIPPFPALADRATGTYNSKAYDWATGWKDDIAPAIEALADNAYDNAVEGAASAAAAAASASTATTQAGTATTQASAASASAVAAAASAATATNAGNVQGTSTSSVAVATAVGQSKTFRYVEASRAIAVGMHLVVAVTASPTTNWMLIQVTAWDSGNKDVTGTVVTYAGSGTYAAWTLSLSGPRGAAGADAVLTTPSLALAGSVTLVAGNNGYTGDCAAGAAIALDTLATLGDGYSVMLVPASTTTAASVTADFGSGSEARRLAGPTLISVKNVSGTYTVRWVPLGNQVPLFGALGTVQQIYGNTTTAVASVQLTATTTVCIYASASGSGYPRCALLSDTALLSTSGDMESVAMSGATPAMVRLNDTEAAAIWSTAGSVKMSLIRNNAGAVAFTAPTTIEAVASTAQALIAHSATKLVAVYDDFTNSRTRGIVCTISGGPPYTTITPGTAYTISSGRCNQIRGDAISATQSVVVLNPAGIATVTQGLVLTEAAGVLTFPASLETLYAGGSANTVGYADVCAITSSRVVITAGNDGSAVAFVAAVAGTGTAATLQCGIQRPIHTPSSLKSCHRLRKLSASCLLHLASVRTSGHASAVQALYVEGDAVRAGAAKNLSRNVSHHDLAYTTGANALTVYVDADDSSKLKMQPFNLGSVL
jgi:hypothetical protein